MCLWSSKMDIPNNFPSVKLPNIESTTPLHSLRINNNYTTSLLKKRKKYSTLMQKHNMMNGIWFWWVKVGQVLKERFEEACEEVAVWSDDDNCRLEVMAWPTLAKVMREVRREKRLRWGEVRLSTPRKRLEASVTGREGEGRLLRTRSLETTLEEEDDTRKKKKMKETIWNVHFVKDEIASVIKPTTTAWLVEAVTHQVNAQKI